MAKCYLCDKDAQGKTCFYCNQPICSDHRTWKGSSRFPYCSLDDKEFYKPLFDFCHKLTKYANDKGIKDKTQILKSVINKVIDTI